MKAKTREKREREMAKRKVTESPAEGVPTKKLMALATQTSKGVKVCFFLISLIFASSEPRHLFHASFFFTGA